MASLGYFEILDAKGNVTERTGVDSLPVRIGRAYTNDVIVADPYVCPLHLEIAVDDQGRLIAQDLDSINGLRYGADGPRVATLELQSGTQFRIGRTLLRYCSINHPLAPTAIDRPTKVSPLLSPHVSVAAGALLFLILILESFLSNVERAKFADIVSEPLVTLATLLGWAGSWALASRIIVSRFHFPQHVTIACGAIIGFTLFGNASEWLEFFFPFIPVLWVSALFGSGLIMAALAYGHLAFASPLRRRSRFIAAILISTAAIGMNAITDYAARNKFSTVMGYNGILKPIDAEWLPAISAEQFIDRSQKIKTELDKLAQKAKGAQP